MTFKKFKITVLGCGTSVGVPSLGRLGWGKCDPNEKKNKRQRCAILVQINDNNILIDAGPDIRNQLLPLGVTKIDGLLITHTHSDHVAGLDDLRVFYWVKKEKIPIYASKKHLNEVKTRFPYLFEPDPESPSYFIPPFTPYEINHKTPLKINDINIQILYQSHGSSFSYGFVFEKHFGYSTDLNDMPEKNFDYLHNIPLWIVESLREHPHQSHAHYDLTFKWIKKVKPKKAILTHLGIDADYKKLLKICPENVEPAYDGMTFNLC